MDGVPAKAAVDPIHVISEGIETLTGSLHYSTWFNSNELAYFSADGNTRGKPKKSHPPHLIIGSAEQLKHFYLDIGIDESYRNSVTREASDVVKV